MVSPDPETIDELSESVQAHLGDLLTGRDVPLLVRTILDGMTPLTVRTYLPVLVERRLREELQASPV